MAEDGPGNTLIVRSLIDGEDASANFGVTLTPNTAIDAMSANTIALFNTENDLTGANAAATTADVQADVNTGLANWNYSSGLRWYYCSANRQRQ